MTATHDQIVWHWLDMRVRYGIADRMNWNWCLEPREHKGCWDVDADTYINGVAMNIDLDYIISDLLVIHERESDVTSYLLVVMFHGPKTDSDGDLISWEHDSCWMDATETESACVEAAGKTFGLIDLWNDRKQPPMKGSKT